ncbi:MAG: type III-B CRISPR-associated protein Cas10/Cmr2 [Actinobacteria bacterium]|nr:type III-B CRISPR-associated protein Cas10/Cmr2 [Actinomycetota bacterium]
MKNQNESYLFFSIGPVQPFLSAARKTKDLYSGSSLLSYLSFLAVKYLHEEIGKIGGKVIFPFYDSSSTVAKQFNSTPNHIYCILPSVDARTIAADIEKKVREKFREISDWIRGQFFPQYTYDSVWLNYWKEQINNFLEVYWVIYEPSEGEEYKAIYRSTEHYLGQRKLLRDFDELKYIENVTDKYGQPYIKCSLISTLSAVHPLTSNSHGLITTFWQNLAKNSKGEFKRNEKLSSVAITKRKFLNYIKANVNNGISVSFPSTRTIAAGSYYRDIYFEIKKQENLNTDLQSSIGDFASKVESMLNAIGLPSQTANYPSLEEVAQTYPKLLKFFRIDSDWLDEESYDAEKISNEYGLEIKDEQKEIIDQTKKVCNSFKAKLKKYNIKTPQKYYAMIFYDGDKMGEIIGDCESKDEHSNLSKNLRSFSTNTVYRIFEGIKEDNSGILMPRLGKVVYSGGDDLLAFVSLEDLFEIVEDINSEFRKILGNNSTKKLTGSMGVVIAHHQTSLQYVLEKVRESLKFSKDKLDRDAISFTLLKRSGESKTVGIKWDNETVENNLLLLKQFGGLIKNKLLSTSLINEIYDELIGLESLSDEAIISEINRLIIRHSNKKESKQIIFNKEIINKLVRYLSDNAFRYKTRLGDDYTYLKHTLELLEFAQFVGKGGN